MLYTVSFDLVPTVSMVACARMLLNIRDVMTLSSFSDDSFASSTVLPSRSSNSYSRRRTNDVNGNEMGEIESWEMGLTRAPIGLSGPEHDQEYYEPTTKRKRRVVRDPLEFDERALEEEMIAMSGVLGLGASGETSPTSPGVARGEQDLRSPTSPTSAHAFSRFEVAPIPTPTVDRGMSWDCVYDLPEVDGSLTRERERQQEQQDREHRDGQEVDATRR